MNHTTYCSLFFFSPQNIVSSSTKSVDMMEGKQPQHKTKTYKRLITYLYRDLVDILLWSLIHNNIVVSIDPSQVSTEK